MLARYGVATGGLSVIAALLLIFLYLIYMVLPLFRGATAEIATRYPVPGSVEDTTLHLAMEEYATLGVRFTESGRTIFFRLDNGAITEERDLPVANGASISSFGHGTVPSALVALGLSNGRAVVARHTYEASYPQSESDAEVPDYEALREITPHIDFPLGETPIRVDENEQPLRLVAIQGDEQQTTLAAYTTDRRLLLSRINVSRSLLGGISLEQKNAALPDPSAEPVGLALNERQDRLFRRIHCPLRAVAGRSTATPGAGADYPQRRAHHHHGIPGRKRVPHRWHLARISIPVVRGTGPGQPLPPDAHTRFRPATRGNSRYCTRLPAQRLPGGGHAWLHRCLPRHGASHPGHQTSDLVRSG
jgi:hypothetical protein